MLTKTEFFKTLIENRVMPMASLRQMYNAQTDEVRYYMHQDNAPNAFLSRHRHGSRASAHAHCRYATWAHEYAVKFDEIVEEAHEEALEMAERMVVLEDDFPDVAFTPAPNAPVIRQIPLPHEKIRAMEASEEGFYPAPPTSPGLNLVMITSGNADEFLEAGRRITFLPNDENCFEMCGVPPVYTIADPGDEIYPGVYILEAWDEGKKWHPIFVQVNEYLDTSRIPYAVVSDTEWAEITKQELDHE